MSGEQHSNLTGCPDDGPRCQRIQPKKWSGGKYPGIYHFNSKSVVVDYIKDKYPDLTAKMSLLQLGWFVTNWKRSRVAVPWEKVKLTPYLLDSGIDSQYPQQLDGSMILCTPGSGDWPIPIVQPADAGEFVNALIKLPPGTELLAYGDLMTMTEYVNLWSKVTGVRATLESATVADHDKLLPGGWGREIGETYAYMQEFGYWGGKNVDIMFSKNLSPEVKITRIEDYMKNEDWSELLNRPVLGSEDT
ncbi:hypothetical protein DL98DRAFT_525075 [Cadophora sp. DSE1049]|nr:hypothetical protein DL98DRAFT_525075 [Cadophora sp. DSE1049]